MFRDNVWMIYQSCRRSLGSARSTICKFFCEFHVDNNNVVKNVFCSHASQQGDYAGSDTAEAEYLSSVCLCRSAAGETKCFKGQLEVTAKCCSSCGAARAG